MPEPEPMNLMDPMIDPYNREKQLKLKVQELEDQVMQLQHARDDFKAAGEVLAAELTAFIDNGKEHGHYFEEAAESLAAWGVVARRCG